jgi:hypothetical protein
MRNNTSHKPRLHPITSRQPGKQEKGIAGIRQLAAFVCELTGQEEGERTRIYTTYGDTLLVVERAESFAEKCGWPK